LALVLDQGYNYSKPIKLSEVLLLDFEFFTVYVQDVVVLTAFDDYFLVLTGEHFVEVFDLMGELISRGWELGEFEIVITNINTKKYLQKNFFTGKFKHPLKLTPSTT
jgi:hypothetical protein